MIFIKQNNQVTPLDDKVNQRDSFVKVKEEMTKLKK